MLDARTSKVLETRVERLKRRARARQQWLERMLSAPAGSPPANQRRQDWITYALERIKRAQDDVALRAGVLDAYTEHLHVLEMTLMSAAEEKGKTVSKS